MQGSSISFGGKKVAQYRIKMAKKITVLQQSLLSGKQCDIINSRVAIGATYCSILKITN